MATPRRVATLSAHFTTHAPVVNDDYVAQLRVAREETLKLLDETNCNPILVRLAWHDAGTYDAALAHDWPKCQGANGSIRFDAELGHGANAGLSKAIGYIKRIKAKAPAVSFADAMQLAAAVAIEHAGGPKIPMRYGRIDVVQETECAVEGNLPDAEAPYGTGAATAAEHLRDVFYRMGFNDREIVALSGAHTIGRAFKERSGVTSFGYGAKNGTKYTGCPFMNARKDGTEGEIGMPGGASWTRQWLKFDNSYFNREYITDKDNLLWLSTDAALHTDPEFSPHFMRYALDCNAFFYDFAAAFAKLSECGARFVGAGVTI